MHADLLTGKAAIWHDDVDLLRDRLLCGARHLARRLPRPAEAPLGGRRRDGAARERKRKAHARGRWLEYHEARAVGALGRDGTATPHLLDQGELAPLRRPRLEPLGRGEGRDPAWRAKGVLWLVWVGRLGRAAVAHAAAACLVLGDEGGVEDVLRVLQRERESAGGSEGEGESEGGVEVKVRVEVVGVRVQAPVEGE